MKLQQFVAVPSIFVIALIVSTGLGAENASLSVSNSHDKALSAPASGEQVDNTNQLKHALAYKQAVARRMLAEVNFYVEKLNLPEPRPIKNTSARVNPAGIGGLGAVETKDFLYSFPGSDRKPITNEHGADWFLECGKLAYIIRKEPFALLSHEVGDDLSALTEKLSKISSRINTNQAYQLATQWLAAVDVDLAALEKQYPPLVTQHFVYDGPITWKLGEEPPLNTPRKLLPIFNVSWGGVEESSPPVSVEIYGPTKELIHLRMEDTRYSRRLPIVITNELELLTTADPPIKQIGGRQPLGVSRTYQEAATVVMLKEVNFLIGKLGLQETNPLLATQVVAYVSAPQTRELGFLESDNYEFHFTGTDKKPRKGQFGCELFAEPGKLIGLRKRNPWRKYENQDRDLDEKFFQLQSLINTNEAYQMATQWLARIQVDVAALEKKYKPVSVQAEFGVGKGVRRKIPVFNVTWGGNNDQESPVGVQIYGPTRELIYLSILDTRFSRRDPIVIPNAAKLNKSSGQRNPE